MLLHYHGMITITPSASAHFSTTPLRWPSAPPSVWSSLSLAMPTVTEWRRSESKYSLIMSCACCPKIPAPTPIAVRAASLLLGSCTNAPPLAGCSHSQNSGTASAQEPNASWPRIASIANFKKIHWICSICCCLRWSRGGRKQLQFCHCHWLPRWPFKPSSPLPAVHQNCCHPECRKYIFNLPVFQPAMLAPVFLFQLISPEQWQQYPLVTFHWKYLGMYLFITPPRILHHHHGYKVTSV